ncbi:MAG: cell division protein FtsA [Verrucomicrobiota bacterium]|nr:cell division protein FtsA [Verrucomicrobiota bacterium]
MSNRQLLSVGVDPGSLHTRCVVGTLENSRLRFLGRGIVESRGWAKSRIADQQAISDSISQAVQLAETDAQVLIENITVGFGGLTVRGANTRSRLDVGRPREIEQRDVNRALERALHVQLQEDRMVLQIFPQDFVIDDHPGHRDPRKMLASNLEANAHLITVSVQEHNALVGAVNQAHLAVEETVFDGVAACYAAVLPEDRRGGIAVIDIGAHSTELVVYYGDALQLASSIPICGDHFTRDIAHFLRIGYEEAVQIKQDFGSAVAESTALNSLIELPIRGERDPRETSRRQLNEILEARAKELFRLVKRELARVGMDRALGGGIVLTGGAAQLHGMCDAAESVLDCQARLGLATGFLDWPEELDDPSWCAAAGLAMYAARLHAQVDLDRQSIGILGRILG